MRRSWLALCFALGLAACAPPGPSPGTALILVASGGFFGGFSTQIFADGTLVTTTSTPGKPPVTVTRHGAPDVYAKAAAVLADEGPQTRRRMTPPTEQCLDYGIDRVEAIPPVAGIDQLSSACPDPALSDLMSHLLATLARP